MKIYLKNAYNCYVNNKKITIACVLLVLLFCFGITLKILYDSQFGNAVYDRNNHLISIEPNIHDEVALRVDNIPETLAAKIVNQEDQQFKNHIGFNPYRIGMGILKKLRGNEVSAISTIPEQLAKNLLRTNNSRSIFTKTLEIFGSIILSGFYDKDEIIRMYVNSVPMGRGIIGMGTASYYYFGKSLDTLGDKEIFLMLQTLKNPNKNNPYSQSEINRDGEKKLQIHPLRSVYYPEFLRECNDRLTCKTSIDKNVQDGIRSAAKDVTSRLFKDGAENAAVVVFDVKQKNIIALVGTPEPTLEQSGYQIDMTNEYRAIGSTIKPFIYGLAFEKGVNGETIVDDSPININLPNGFSMYPKNFDGKFRGKVPVKEALSQSLNIPAVRMLQYVGLVSFYGWLEKKVGAILIQPGIEYGSSTALGALELTPIQLGYLFTIFPQMGEIMPYSLIKDTIWSPKGITPHMIAQKKVINPHAIMSITDILSNRNLGVEQFGVNSNLQLGISHYALKTGTSKKYHDSWVVGYTPEIVCVVWMGNARHDPMNEVTGQKGAGELWEKVMDILIARKFINDVPFPRTNANDAQEQKHVPRIQNTTVFMFPQKNDVLMIAKGDSIEIRTNEVGEITINGKKFTHTRNALFSPKENGIVHISFNNDDIYEEMNVSVVLQ